MQVSISIEGSMGLTWPSWQRIVAEVEDSGFAGLYHTDHWPGDQAALELIASLSYVAQHTSRIHFGSLVAPMSFRDPRTLAWQAAAIDDLSGGRLILGLGTGWAEDEHRAWGYELGDKATRLARFEEGLEVITRLLRCDEPVTFEGRFYHLQGARLLPRPQRPGGPRILIGGNGQRRILPLVARYADVWNASNISISEFKERSVLLSDLACQAGRKPEDIKRTLFLSVLCGRNEVEIKQRLNWLYRGMPDLTALPLKEQLERIEQIFTPVFEKVGTSYNVIIGSVEEAVERMRTYREAGVEEFIVQWPDPNDIEGMRLLAREVLPRLNH